MSLIKLTLFAKVFRLAFRNINYFILSLLFIFTNSSLNLKNFIKTSKNFSFGLTIAISSLFTGSLKAEETPDLCKDVLGTLDSSTGAYSKSAAEIATDGTYFCAGTPDRFELSIYEMGLCTSNPITGSPKEFSKTNCC